MSHYRTNLRDVEFALFDVLDIGSNLGTGLYPDLDIAAARDLLVGAEHLSREHLADALVDGDRTPPVFDRETGDVTTPESTRKAYQTYMDAELWRLGISSALGGVAAPQSLRWAMIEQLLGANTPIMMYAAGPTMADILHHEGTPQQQHWARLCVIARWGATMALTEPDVGSDLGAIRSSATAQPDGSWHLTGVKRFITCGEHDLADNIVHFVLARPKGVPGVGGPGTAGLSVFLVPKYLFDPETGQIGERNGVRATRLEDKMGLRASPTCELTFGGERPAVGWLLGERYDGIRQMFRAIEHARMMVAAKAVATLSSGYLVALDFARTRIQGHDLAIAKQPDGPRIPILGHPDIRRSLLLQKSYAEGLRALLLYVADWQDEAIKAAANGDNTTARAARRMSELLLPVLKGCAAERAFELLGQESLQTLGGSGFLRDYPLEQYVRDTKIDALYEGTTAIQSLDLIFRQIARDRGAALSELLDRIRAFIRSGADDPPRRALATALADATVMADAMLAAVDQGQDRAQVHRAGRHGRRLLLALGDLLIGWLLQQQAEIATARTDHRSPVDAAFGHGKAAAAAFFAEEVLPRLSADRATVVGTGFDLMALSDKAW